MLLVSIVAKDPSDLAPITELITTPSVLAVNTSLKEFQARTDTTLKTAGRGFWLAVGTAITLVGFVVVGAFYAGHVDATVADLSKSVAKILESRDERGKPPLPPERPSFPPISSLKSSIARAADWRS